VLQSLAKAKPKKGYKTPAAIGIPVHCKEAKKFLIDIFHDCMT
jgi:hypothetical protein